MNSENDGVVLLPVIPLIMLQLVYILNGSNIHMMNLIDMEFNIITP
ncbi:hypothetical protein KAW18_18440 [candidate division WOR-3 bacterium]|nr:hypothetical protein [candidate division WOR-3 bacterium]